MYYQMQHGDINPHNFILSHVPNSNPIVTFIDMASIVISTIQDNHNQISCSNMEMEGLMMVADCFTGSSALLPAQRNLLSGRLQILPDNVMNTVVWRLTVEDLFRFPTRQEAIIMLQFTLEIARTIRPRDASRSPKGPAGQNAQQTRRIFLSGLLYMACSCDTCCLPDVWRLKPWACVVQDPEDDLVRRSQQVMSALWWRSSQQLLREHRLFNHNWRAEARLSSLKDFKACVRQRASILNLKSRQWPRILDDSSWPISTLTIYNWRSCLLLTDAIQRSRG